MAEEGKAAALQQDPEWNGSSHQGKQQLNRSARQTPGACGLPPLALVSTTGQFGANCTPSIAQVLL